RQQEEELRKRSEVSIRKYKEEISLSQYKEVSQYKEGGKE
uniref:Uncharacterized protein n=1 Tax=Cucumis melo TaxID=3656 RepID=A0A9I9E1B8_CUCME